LLDGQAGAAVAAELGDKPESAALRFGSHQDALDYASKVVENSKDWLARKNSYVAESYKRGEFEIVIELSTGVFAGNYHLIFTAIPCGVVPEGEVEGNSSISGGCNLKAEHADLHASSPQRNQNGVLVDVAKLVETPQGVVTSFVRFEPAKQRCDLTWNILIKANMRNWTRGSDLG
jgi:hypothetical protein